MTRLTLLVAWLAFPLTAFALDVDALWDFERPELSEQRFRAALAGATADEAIVLQTQIARTYGLRRDFARALGTLATVEPRLSTAGAEARARWWLERGRALVSATHPPTSQTTETRERARAAYLKAVELAQGSHLDGLAVDALHMLAFVDTAPVDALRWNQRALALARSSAQPQAQRWQAALHNNIGHALHELGRLEEALAAFRAALALREAGPNSKAVRIARWSVAWTLRGLKRHDEALDIQLRLEREGDAAGEPDPYVFEELAHLYRARGDHERARRYAERASAIPRQLGR